MARAKKLGECGSDETLLWLTFLPSLNILWQYKTTMTNSEKYVHAYIALLLNSTKKIDNDKNKLKHIYVSLKSVKLI